MSDEIICRCPFCGSDLVRVAQLTSGTQDVVEWELGPNGDPQPADYGETNTWDEGAEEYGYDCGWCCREFPLPTVAGRDDPAEVKARAEKWQKRRDVIADLERNGVELLNLLGQIITTAPSEDLKFEVKKFLCKIDPTGEFV